MPPRETTPRRLTAISLVTMMLGMILAGNAAVASSPQAHVLRVQQAYFPQSLDPQQSSGTFLGTVLGANYEGLTRLDNTLNAVPAAAETWEVDDTLTTWTFKLRPNLTYSDGSPLTAERFADAVRRTCDPNVGADYQAILFDVAGCQAFATLFSPSESGTPSTRDVATYDAARSNVGVRAIDDCTLVIQLTHPAPYFLAITSLAIFYPAKEELIARGGERWWADPALQIGNGPFQITGLVPDQRITLTANPLYWHGRPKLDQLEYVYEADTGVALKSYRAGDLDIISVVSDFLPSIESDARLRQELVQIPAASTGYLSFNLTTPPFTDKHVREAFSYAFDRDSYCQQLRSGGCEPALSWIPPDVPGAIETDAYAFDPSRAQQALASSAYGSPEALPRIAFAYWVDDPSEKVKVEWIAQRYREILGIDIVLQPMGGDELVAAMSDVATSPQMVLAGWVQDYPDPQNWLSVYWGCQTSFALDVGFCDPRFDTLIDQADREADPAERLGLYQQAGEILVSDVPGVFLSHGIFLYLVKPEVTGNTPTSIDAGWPGQTTSLLTADVSG